METAGKVYAYKCLIATYSCIDSRIMLEGLEGALHIEYQHTVNVQVKIFTIYCTYALMHPQLLDQI